MTAIPKTKAERNELRKQMITLLEESLNHTKPEDSFFYCHPNEDHIILSHALFWVMTKTLSGKAAKQKFLLLLRQYQEEMLEAYLTESPDFPDLLHYCNVIYEYLPYFCRALGTDRSIRKLQCIIIVAGGYGGDIPEDQCQSLLDDIDFHYNRICCSKIEQLLPTLNQFVTEEANYLP